MLNQTKYFTYNQINRLITLIFSDLKVDVTRWQNRHDFYVLVAF